MRVLVTGSNGYIGSVLVPQLLAAGHSVVGMDTRYFADSTFGQSSVEFEERMADVRDLELADLEGFDAICHLAALSNDPLGNLKPQLTDEVNHQGTIHLAKLARAAGVERFAFSSSCSLYGASGDAYLNEQASLSPITPYGASKADSEYSLSKLADDSFTPVFLRNATAYGASPRLRLDLVINDFVAAACLHGRIEIRSDGTPWRPLVHVQDISHAFVEVLAAPREAVHNQAFNVGRTNENYRVSELAEIVRQSVPGTVIEYAPGGGPDLRCYRVDCGKISRHIPSFKPKWDVRRGVQELADAFKNAPLTAGDVEHKRFLRLPILQRLMAAGVVDADLRRRIELIPAESVAELEATR
jgi:nucleoside-diphosphate-sugar epimerase